MGPSYFMHLPGASAAKGSARYAAVSSNDANWAFLFSDSAVISCSSVIDNLKFAGVPCNIEGRHSPETRRPIASFEDTAGTCPSLLQQRLLGDGMEIGPAPLALKRKSSTHMQ